MMDNEAKVWVVYRKSDPWPIRHIVECGKACSESELRTMYYRDYFRFEDDCFCGFQDMKSAFAFEDSLKNGGIA